jgi:putative transposase
VQLLFSAFSAFSAFRGQDFLISNSGYVRYGVSYRDVEEIFAERNVKVDYSALNRWVIKYLSSLAAAAKKSKRTVTTSWKMDETYLKVKYQWVYLYRVVDKLGDTVDFMLSEKRDESVPTAFFKQAIDNNGFPNKVVMDNSGDNDKTMPG